MNVDVILFDLDDTLLVQDASVDASIVAALREVSTPDMLAHHDTDLVKLVHNIASSLWWGHPLGAYCRRIGISPGEGMWGRFMNDDPGASGLHMWAQEFRQQLWSAVLDELGLRDNVEVARVSEAFVRQRSSRHVLFPEALTILSKLRNRYRLGLVTNGASDLQGEKIRASGLGKYFDVVTISGEVGVGKPDPAIFDHPMNQLNVGRQACAMVGNSLESDIAGALRAGIHAVWLNFSGASSVPPPEGAVEISSLTELSFLKAVGG